MACSVSRLDFKQRVCCLHFMWEATNVFFSIGTQFVIFEEVLPYVFSAARNCFEGLWVEFPVPYRWVFLLSINVGVGWRMSQPQFECELGFLWMLGALSSHGSLSNPSMCPATLRCVWHELPSPRVWWHLRFKSTVGGVAAACVIGGESGIGWPTAWWEHS